MKRLQALKSLLSALGLDGDITTLNNRKLLQKAVYVGQRFGVDLGYRYGWYVRGPYSTALTRDYYSLAEKDVEELRVSEEAQRSLKRAAELLSPPESVELAQPEWAELVASVDFLQRVSEFSPQQIRERIEREKSHLVNYIDEAFEKLECAGLAAE